MDNKFIQPLRSDIIREIEKRGVSQNRKNAQTGLVVKNTNKNNVSSSFGWGAVDDAIPLNKKNLENVRRNFVSIMNEVIQFKPLEKMVEEIKQVVSEPSAAKRAKHKEAIVRWHTYCVDRHEGGSIGLVPECYQGEGVPPLDDFMNTNVGHVLKHFCDFIKREF
jgi:hypothetical protein